jgi:hypothetical protein
MQKAMSSAKKVAFIFMFYVNKNNNPTAKEMIGSASVKPRAINT